MRAVFKITQKVALYVLRPEGCGRREPPFLLCSLVMKILTYLIGERLWRCRLHFLLSSVLLLMACSASQKSSKPPAPKVLRYTIAPKTSRADVVSVAMITLVNYTFTIEYYDSRRDYDALRTAWRFSTQTLTSPAGEVKTLQVRDRASLHLSRRGVESDRSTSVASNLEFEMEMKGTKKDQWLRITPDPAFQEQYASIVDDLKNRLRHRGYQFN
jgi:hypothetical protein